MRSFNIAHELTYEHHSSEYEHFVATIYKTKIYIGILVRFRLLHKQNFEFIVTPEEYNAKPNFLSHLLYQY